MFTPSIITEAGNNPHCFFLNTNQTHTICVTMPTPGPHNVLYPINQKVKIDKKEHKNPSQCFFKIIRIIALVLQVRYNHLIKNISASEAPLKRSGSSALRCSKFS